MANSGFGPIRTTEIGAASALVIAIYMVLFFLGFVVSQNVLIAVVTDGFEKAKSDIQVVKNRFTSILPQYFWFLIFR